MITAVQLRVARALLGIDQPRLAEMACVSLPTIQRLEASRGNVAAGIEPIGNEHPNEGCGHDVRLKEPS